jgi:putative nucleotidyltransferase with HDIG domain
MAIPSPDAAERILASHALPDGIVVHSRGVAAVAGEAARLLAANGVGIDPSLAEAAGLLHDIDKLATRRGGAEHGTLAAAWLTELGHAELAEAVAAHPVIRLLDPARAPRSWEARVVHLADRLVNRRCMTIDQRLDDQADRYPRFRATLERARGPAHALEAELAAAAGMTVADFEAQLRAAAERVLEPAR